MSEQSLPPGALEEKHFPAVRIALAALGLVAVVAVSAALIWGLFSEFSVRDRRTLPTAIEIQRLKPPAPRLESNPRGDGDRIRKAAQDELERWRYVDRAAGRAEIPIETAMRLLAQRGWPDTEEKP